MKSTFQPLLKKAEDSLQAAELLRHEGYPGFAVSRAYYAMFYVAQALLLEQGQSFSSHSAVIAAFGKVFAKTGLLDPQYHRWLIDAQDYRNAGDYGVGESISEDELTDVLTWGKEFLRVAQQYLQK